MQGLLLRLSSLDSDAESAVRVIAYFDSLVRDHATVPVMLQATARLAQCPVGLVHAGDEHGMRVLPDGKIHHSAPPPLSAVTWPLGSALGLVWMEREGGAHGLDAIVLERFAGAATVAMERVAGPGQAVNDPALVELVLSSGAGDTERTRALRLLGFDPSALLRVLASPAAESDDGGVLAVALRRAGRHARAARVGATAAIIVASAVDGLPEIAGGPRVGIGPVAAGSGAPDSWAGAQTALRFAVAGARAADRVVNWTDLGALALFAAHVPDDAIAALPDVRALETLSRSPHGKETVEAVEALCEAGSVRRAAAAVHLHHSSMAARIARAEAALGFSLSDPGGRLRAHLALRLLRLRADVSDAGPGATPSRARRRPGG